jgi:peptidoglycan/LPS O-acetylase OafA/YrhL
MSQSEAAPPQTQNGQAPSSLAFRHFPELDGLRGVAITLVVAGHVLKFGIGVDTDFGGLGVLLFFLLSGFLITGLLNKERVQNGRISLPRFYIRRALRLFPASFVFLAVLCLLIKTRLVMDTTWYTIAACFLYVRNTWGHGPSSDHIWSLSLEEQFYAGWPWIMNAFSQTVALWVAMLTILAISGFRMMAIYGRWFVYEDGPFGVRTWFRIDSILLGCVLALLFCQPVVTNRLRTYFSHPLMPLVLWPATLAWSIWGENLTHVWYLTAQMVLSFLILVNLLVSKKSAYLSFFSHPAAAWVGRISYSWYLWQQLFTVITFPRWGGLRAFPINVLASLALAMISQRIIERPFLKLKERIGHGAGIKSGRVWAMPITGQLTSPSAPPQES